MAAESLRNALLDSAHRTGRFELSAQAIPNGDEVAQEQIWDHWLARYKNAACWTTPELLRQHGLGIAQTPSHGAGPHHVDVTHPANPDKVDVDTVVREYQMAFYGPGAKREVTHEWTTENLRGLQQPS